MTAGQGRGRLSRRALGTGLVLALSTPGCGGAIWLGKEQLAPIKLPPRVVIMVWKSRRVYRSDDEGFADATASALQAALGERGYETTVTPMSGDPRLPRIELAFWSIDYGSSGRAEGVFGQGSITVDCAFVNERDEVAFVGRVTASGEDGNLGIGAQKAAQAIADLLVEG